MKNDYTSNIKNHIFSPSTLQRSIKILPEGTQLHIEEELLTEHQLNVYINDMLVMSLSCTPTNLEELVLGRLYSEGIIKGIDDIDYFYLCETGHTAKIFLKHNVSSDRFQPDIQVPTCCTNNRIYWKSGESIKPLTPIDWKTEWVFKLAEEFEKDTLLHKQTYGTHSSFLAQKDKVLYCCEDIGRHNAIDKVIGLGLKNHIDLTHTMIFTSGRVPTDMVEKVIRARIPIFISKAAPTKQSVDLAEEYGLILIAGAHSDNLKIYHDVSNETCNMQPSRSN